MKNASEQLNDVLKSINSVKRVLRNKKCCYEACEDETIRMIFLVSLKTELDSWISAGIPMEEIETVSLYNIQKEFDEE